MARGSLQIVVLVLLVVALSAATLFILATNSREQRQELGDVRFVESINMEEQKIYFSIDNGGRNAFAEAYEGIAGSILSKNPSEIYADFEQKFASSFRERFAKEQKYLDEKQISEIKITASPEGARVELPPIAFHTALSIEKRKYILLFSYSEVQGRLAVSHNPAITRTISFNMAGLPEFGRLLAAYDLCRQRADSRACFEANTGMNAEVSGQSKHVVLTSKNSFLINGNLRAISVKLP